MNDMTKDMTFILCHRLGKKWIGIAGTSCEAASCLACAETVFAAVGLSGEVQWGSVEKQKNYAGRSADFREVEISERERKLHWFIGTAKRAVFGNRLYATFEAFCETYPSASEYRTELEPIW